jgi:hypothetical protein
MRSAISAISGYSDANNIVTTELLPKFCLVISSGLKDNVNLPLLTSSSAPASTKRCISSPESCAPILSEPKAISTSGTMPVSDCCRMLSIIAKDSGFVTSSPSNCLTAIICDDVIG